MEVLQRIVIYSISFGQTNSTKLLTYFYITTIDQYLHTAKAQQSDPNCQIPACEFSIIFDPLNNEFHYHISTFLYL